VLLRTGLALLAAVELALGLWTSLLPASFCAHVPTVDLTPPISEHPFRSFGGATSDLAVDTTAAAVGTEPRLVEAASPAYRASPSRSGVPPPAPARPQRVGGHAGVVALAGSVVLAVALLVVTLRWLPAPSTSRGAPARSVIG
jgi:hypothetical protein